MKFASYMFLPILAGLCMVTALLAGGEAYHLTVSGLVKQPAVYSSGDLRDFKAVRARYCEIGRSGDFKGVFDYSGVSLKTLLEHARISKDGDGYSKPIDLAVVIRDGKGGVSILSWGEVMYGGYSEFIIALDAKAAMPMKDCGSCHTGGEEKKWRAPMDRRPGLPRLVMPGDARDSRAIEGVRSVEVLEIVPGPRRGKGDSPESFTITDGKRTREVASLEGAARVEIEARQVGDGKGFHGLKTYSGVSLAGVLEKNGFAPGGNAILYLTASDGYRSALSAGELTLGARGGSIMVADRLEGRPLGREGAFNVIFPGDSSADRWVKQLKTIEIVEAAPARREGKLLVIGVGPGDTAQVTLAAISAMAKADCFIATKDIAERFSHYMAGKPVLYDPLTSQMFYIKKTNPRLNAEEAKKMMAENRKRNKEALTRELHAGKIVGLLDYGDPTIYGSWTYWLPGAIGNTAIRVVPGISAFNAGNAMIGRNIVYNGSAVITVPDGILSNEPLLAATAAHGDTVAIFVGLHEIERLMPVLRKYYRDDTPAVVAYRAGYAREGRLVKTTLGGLPGVVEQNSEKFLGIIYIGPCVGDAPAGNCGGTE